MPHRRVAATLLVACLVGCGVPQAPRWERSEPLTPESVSGGAVSESSENGLRFILDAEPVVAVSEFPAVVRAGAAQMVTSPVDGQIVGRTTSVGSDIASGTPVFELAALPVLGDELRDEILRRERDLAVLLEDDVEVARLDAEIAALDTRRSSIQSTVDAPVDGVVSEYVANVRDTVAIGDPLFAIGSADRTEVIVEVFFSDGVDPLVGDTVRVLLSDAVLDDPVEAEIIATAIDAEKWTVTVDVTGVAAVGDRIRVLFGAGSQPTSRRAPLAGVRDLGGNPHVIVERSDGRWERVRVRTGVVTADHVELLEWSGSLSVGDVLVGTG